MAAASRARVRSECDGDFVRSPNGQRPHQLKYLSPLVEIGRTLKLRSAMPDQIQILVVDDEPALREVFGAALTESGYRVDVAADGRSCRALLSANRYDLAILDAVLPDEPGIALGKLAHSYGSRIIFMTAADAQSEQFEGADRVLQKPFHIAEFLDTVEEVLKRTETI